MIATIFLAALMVSLFVANQVINERRQVVLQEQINRLAGVTRQMGHVPVRSKFRQSKPWPKPEIQVD